MRDTNQEFPLVSIIMATYNRAKTIERAINSVLKQSYTNIELIVVDDGSSDETLTILDRFRDSRIRILRHEKNMGVCAAKNTGLRNIKGDWFTTFDSDDEMIAEAIETMMSIPLSFDKNVTAVTCNGLDTSMNRFTGKGLSNDQYLDVDSMMTSINGDFWGLTKTSLLLNDRFNENLSGLESVLWYKIDDRARRYYIHKQLLIVHTEGNDRVSNSKYDMNKETKFYSNLIYEVHYLSKIQKYFPDHFVNICRNGLIVTAVNHDREKAAKYYEYLTCSKSNLLDKLVFNFWLAAFLKNRISIIDLRVKSYIIALLK